MKLPFVILGDSSTTSSAKTVRESRNMHPKSSSHPDSIISKRGDVLYLLEDSEGTARSELSKYFHIRATLLSIVRLIGVILRILFRCIMMTPIKRIVLTDSSLFAPARRERRTLKEQNKGMEHCSVLIFFYHELLNSCAMGRDRC